MKFRDPILVSKDRKISLNRKLLSVVFPQSVLDQRLIIACNPTGYGFMQIRKAESDFFKDLPNKEINDIIFQVNKIIDC